MKQAIIRVAQIPRISIYARLCLEEALLYKTSDNWYLHSDCPSDEPPTIVLGISGKPHLLCNLDLVTADSIALIRRFSGGGTVIVDHNIIFSSLIMNRHDLPDVKPYPREIMSWTEGVYGPALAKIAKKELATANFSVRENDYVFGDLKFGGNAQAISKDRWVHHTSFLWGVNPEAMRYLSMPSKRPAYRGERDHRSFLTPLHNYVTHRNDVYKAVVDTLASHFQVTDTSAEEIEDTIRNLGGWDAWCKSCRTKVVGVDGKSLVDVGSILSNNKLKLLI